MQIYIQKLVAYCRKRFTPKLPEILHKRKYTKDLFRKDCIAALTVSVISIPLAMALAIASGVSPAQGLYTAIIAGFCVALFGGCRYQYSGPTSTFVVIVLTVMGQYGYDGLAMVMLIAGTILILAGFLKIGLFIVRYIPYPVVVGFTSGIGILLISTQVKDLLGLRIEKVPAAFVPKWEAYFNHFDNVNGWAIVVALMSAGCIFGIKKYRPQWPVFLVSVVASAVFVGIFGINVDTIGTQFGNLPHFLPMPRLPEFNLALMLQLFPTGLTVALLGGVESLLSAKVVDSMSSDNHYSNTELIGEGVATIACTFFGGLPTTGSLARTAANYKAGAYSPVSGIMHSVFLLLIMLLFAGLAQYVPLTCLAVVLTLVGWNMLNVRKIITLIHARPGDRYTFIVTLLLTIFVDLNTAISVGFMMASIIFMHRMSYEIEFDTDVRSSKEKPSNEIVPPELAEQGVVSFRVAGPLFFGGIEEIAHFFNEMEIKPRVLILRMGQVTMVDASGANLIVELIRKFQKNGGRVILSNMKRQPRRVLHDTFRDEEISLDNISAASNFANAVKMARRFVK